MQVLLALLPELKKQRPQRLPHICGNSYYNKVQVTLRPSDCGSFSFEIHIYIKEIHRKL